MTLLLSTFNKICSQSCWRHLSKTFSKNGFSTTASNLGKVSDEKVKERQKELMARGLPKKRKLPGVKHVVLVN